MTSELGNATLDLNVDLKNFNEGIDQAQENTEQLGDTGERTGKRLSGAFGRIGKRIQGAARNIPIIGEELASLPPTSCSSCRRHRRDYSRADRFGSQRYRA